MTRGLSGTRLATAWAATPGVSAGAHDLTAAAVHPAEHRGRRATVARRIGRRALEELEQPTCEVAFQAAADLASGTVLRRCGGRGRSWSRGDGSCATGPPCAVPGSAGGPRGVEPWRIRSPDDAGRGATPASAAKAASLRIRPGWDQASRIVAAPMTPTPSSPSRAGAVSRTSSSSSSSSSSPAYSTAALLLQRKDPSSGGAQGHDSRSPLGSVCVYLSSQCGPYLIRLSWRTCGSGWHTPAGPALSPMAGTWGCRAPGCGNWSRPGKVLDLADFQDRLDALRHPSVDVDGQVVHVVHAPGQGPDPMPLVLTHGWPGSFYEYLDPRRCPTRLSHEPTSCRTVFDRLLG